MADFHKLPIQDIQKLPKKAQIQLLEKLVKYHNKRYFIDNNPEISDEDFDAFTEELKKLDPQNSALFEIVGEIGDVTHPYPMLSLDKVFNYGGVVKFLNDTNDTNYLIEPKYDGMHAMYRVKDRILATRGNGKIGENISGRFRFLKLIGKIRKDADYVEGEIVIPQNYFEKYLSKAYKNSRNAVVGIIKSKTITPEGIEALKQGGVHFVLYDTVDFYKATKEELLEKERFDEILEQIFHSIYPLDGAVIKVTSEKIKEHLGSTAHHQKWQIAYKIPGERKWTRVLKIIDQVGRTGRITSVAKIFPINLSGAEIKNVTLHNFDYIQKSKIGVGSKVEIIRSGEVIPFVTQVVPAKKVHPVPKYCPICHTKTFFNGKYLECTNKECPEKLWQEIEYFFKTLRVEELGEKRIKKFIEEFKLKSIENFYDLTWDQIAKIPGFGEKSGKKIVGNIQATLNKSTTPIELLNALGIKEVGGVTAGLILSKYPFSSLKTLSIEDLLEIKGIGPQTAKSFVNEIKNKWGLVKFLQSRGLEFKKTKKTSILKDLVFCITGEKEKYSRDELIKMINENGGVYKPSVTKNLNYLIAGEKAGSKIKKAKQLNIKIINEKDFLNMLNI